MLKKVLAVGFTAAALAAVAAPASAAGFCYDAEVVVNGTAVVDQADCINAG